MNVVTITGNLVRDPEYHVTDSGTQICGFSIAVNRFGSEGVDYPRVKVFGKQAENCNKYLSKGKKVGITGRLQTGSYEKDGQKVYTTDVIANNVEFLSPVEKKEIEPEQPQMDFATLEENVPF